MTDNELIAEFMGGSLEKRDFITIGGKRTGKWTFPDRTWCYDDQLQYSKRWDWLMPVVEKIEDLTRSNKIVGNLLSMWTYYYNVFNGTINTDITVAYQLVVEFIKWYNENKTK